jgi:hypothetical protein
MPGSVDRDIVDLMKVTTSWLDITVDLWKFQSAGNAPKGTIPVGFRERVPQK